jgi:hypothetical protein
MSSLYELIGRLVVALVWRRYGRQIQTTAAVGAGLTALAIGAYLASRRREGEGEA